MRPILRRRRGIECSARFDRLRDVVLAVPDGTWALTLLKAGSIGLRIKQHRARLAATLRISALRRGSVMLVPEHQGPDEQ